MSFLICSSARAVRKQLGETPKAFFPHAASPAVMPTGFGSAMPTWTSCFGSALPNGPSLPDPRESLVTAIMLRSALANFSSVAANSSRLARPIFRPSFSAIAVAAGENMDGGGALMLQSFRRSGHIEPFARQAVLYLQHASPQTTLPESKEGADRAIQRCRSSPFVLDAPKLRFHRQIGI